MVWSNRAQITVFPNGEMCYKPTPDLKLRAPMWAARPRSFMDSFMEGEEGEDEGGFTFFFSSFF